MIGTPWLPDLTDHVLMIEEVSEPLYRIDRMLFQLAHATQLRGIVGIRLGAIRDVQENDPPFAETPEQMITRWCGEMGVPYLRSEEHTSELQSLMRISYAVFCLKKKNIQTHT